ncbi:MAG: hypothetical protein GY731_15800, partial [Gammaproteobacteria bacterium]|nr:hypothetical protein [Gammaproteobacteria bacterium]
QANNTTNTFTSGLTVNGAWNLNSAGSLTNMIFSGAQTIDGSGAIALSDHTQNRIYSGGNNLLTVDNGMTIRGAGQIGLSITSLLNKGAITADQSNTLTIATGGTGFDNLGNLNATGGGGINLTGNFTTSGNVEIAADSQINRTGTFLQTAGQTNVDGTLTSTGLVYIQGGLLSGSGQINGDVDNAGMVGPGNSAGLLSIDGDYEQLVAGTLYIELGGLLSGTEYDVLDVSGTADLGGTLDVSLIGGFNPLVGASFDILSADSILDTFNVLNLTSGSGYIWDVAYLADTLGPGTTDVVRLTVLTAPAVPVPTAVWLFGSALIGLMGVARRRRNHS